jgi:hypothetical protein
MDEAVPLMSALGTNGIPYLYYDGKVEGLPSSPLEGTRFVFLDIELQGMKSQNDKTKASALIARLKKIISTSNGPYVIIFWTKHSEIIDQVIKNCSKASIPPVTWLDLEKAQCIDAAGKYDLQKISDGLREKLKAIGAFTIYVEWENTLHSASKKFINDFSGLIPNGEKWSNETSTLFYNLYKAYVDDNTLQDTTEQFKCACWIMNSGFLDILQKYSATNLKLPNDFTLLPGKIDVTILSKINSYLFLNDNLLSRPMTGYVYEDTDKNLKNSLIKSIFKTGEAPKGCKLCKIIVTPACDLAQNKTLIHKNRDDEKKVHRVVFGLLLTFNNDLKKKIKKTEAMFTVGAFWYKKKTQIIILHFSSLTFQHEGQFNNSPLFCLSNDLVFDIQSKAANNINRLGNFQLE